MPQDEVWKLPGLLGKCFNERDEFRGTVLKVGGNPKETANTWLYY